MGTPITNAKAWLQLAAVALVSLTAPDIARADLLCPAADATPVVVVAVPELVEVVLSTVLQKGVAVLLLGATAVVSLPWLVAGVAVALFYVPRWLKAQALRV